MGPQKSRLHRFHKICELTPCFQTVKSWDMCKWFQDDQVHSALFVHYFLHACVKWNNNGYFTLPCDLRYTRAFYWVYSALFNKVTGSDNCCGSSLRKPLVFPSVSLHFPHSAWWVHRYCAQLKFPHLFSLKIKLLLQIYTDLLNLRKPRTPAVQKALLFV